MKLLRYFIASIFLALVYYLIFACLISTDNEKILKAENRVFEELYPQMKEKEKLVSDVILHLQARDNEIYEQLFHSPAPTVERLASVNALFSNDSIQDRDLVRYTSKKLASTEMHAAAVDANFREIYDILLKNGGNKAPMSKPLKDMSYAQLGAGVGNKMNPFYKVETRHNGIDLIAPAGTDVYAGGKGVVTGLKRSRKGEGNVVEIMHEGGYRSRYAHLADINVGIGRRVDEGTVIGNVGSTGNTFAPHLHYEVWKDTLAVNPIHFFFGQVTPPEYANMMVMSATTRQSLD